MRSNLKYSRIGTNLLVLLGVALLALAPARVRPVYAAAITVDSLADTVAADGACTLREAIRNANSNSDTSGGDCQPGSGADSITFDVSGIITLGAILPSIAGELTIDGAGQSVTISGNNAVPVIFVNSGASLTILNLTVSNGKDLTGAGIRAWGSLTVANSTFSGNTASRFGGAIEFLGPALTIDNSTFSGNRVLNGRGGGVSITSGSNHSITNSTFSGNSASVGGSGIFIQSGPITITNSTISGNSGSGIHILNPPTPTLVNTIVANNSGGDCISGVIVADSYNLDSDGTCGNATTLTAAQLNLGLLADNGGPTHTMALLPGSAAIDAGDDAACPAADQRGVPRPQGGHCDAGAYEVKVVNQPPVAGAGGPYLGAVGAGIQFDGSGSSDADSDPLTYAWDFGDGSSGAGVMPTHSYSESGIYNVCLAVDDGQIASDLSCSMAVVYDPSGGFVTGGGWIDSPGGAYRSDETLNGKANFGFVSRYKKGASLPEGSTEFQFQAGGFNFHSDTYEWLVVNQGGANAQFKGSGLVNGTLDPNGGAYKFMLWSGDGDPDTFRIRIWWEDSAGKHVVYDNGFDQPIGSGSIVVHKGK